jgi:hypothetical protein
MLSLGIEYGLRGHDSVPDKKARIGRRPSGRQHRRETDPSVCRSPCRGRWSPRVRSFDRLTASPALNFEPFRAALSLVQWAQSVPTGLEVGRRAGRYGGDELRGDADAITAGSLPGSSYRPMGLVMVLIAASKWPAWRGDVESGPTWYESR